MTLRRHLIELLSDAPRSVSSIAREMGLHRRDADEDLRHALRSAAAAGHHVEVIPARCKSCGFVFADDRLVKPGRCPSCKGSRLFEPQIRLIVLLLACLVAARRVDAQSLRIVNATVVDVATGELHRGSTIAVQGNRIVSVGAATTMVSGGQVIDARSGYVIPGLWDMHTHAFFGDSAPDGRDLILPSFVANGVTGIRDMGSSVDAVLRARADVATHRLLGPRMIVSGPMLDGPKVSFPASIAITTPAVGRDAVDSLKRRGVDFIKIQSGVPRDAYFAIADEAKKLGIPFEGHVPDAIRASEAIAAGQRTFEHLIGIFEASSPDEDKYIRDKYDGGTKRPSAFLQTYDPAREARIIQDIAAARLWQCPTLFWERGQWLVDIVNALGDRDLAYAAKSWIARWPVTRASILKGLASDPLPVREEFVAHELDIMRKLHAAKVPFLAGTDTPAGVDVLPGISLHLELERFVAAGFTPLEALQTATLNPALFYEKTGEYGSVQPGRVADLVMLSANPLTDIRNTRAIVGVVVDGRYLSSADLDGLRAKLRKSAANR
jgi:imidazolonepropionase-like amidohydrolase/predicted Zn-ribbon and HTH transcriptional regulator